ncbi:hypothetical protein MKEN_00498100 [Mycena kentingensis (nom. inval.)]|nr:hypothetical protein MKEN_00498100 [Mycena kentingensis (nom. inval.)]
MASEARLPRDLERAIFECAALDLDNALNLVQTARRVQEWIEPLIYTTLTLAFTVESTTDFSNTKPPQMHRRLAAALHTKPTSFFAAHTRRVFLGKSLSHAETELVLDRCTNITSFVFDTSWPPSPAIASGTFPDNHAFARLQRVWLDFRQLRSFSPASVNAGAGFLPSLTHVTLYYLYSDAPGLHEAYIGFLSALPALTHVCICMVQSASFLRLVLAHCRHLQVLLHAFDAGMYEREMYIADMEAEGVDAPADARCVLIDYTCGWFNWVKWVHADWRLAAGMQVLDRAKKFVEMRGNGAVPAEEFIWEDPEAPPESDEEYSSDDDEE